MYRYIHMFTYLLQHQFSKTDDLLMCWWQSTFYLTGADGGKNSWSSYHWTWDSKLSLDCKRSATHACVPMRLENNTNKCRMFSLFAARQLVGFSPAHLWSKLKPSLWSVHKYALTHSTPTFRNANVNWSTQGHLKDVCFHGLTCKKNSPSFLAVFPIYTCKPAQISSHVI